MDGDRDGASEFQEHEGPRLGEGNSRPMRCVAALATLTFEHHLPLLDTRRAVRELVIGDQAIEDDLLAPALADGPVSVDLVAERTRVVVSGHSWSVGHELADFPERYVDLLAAQFDRGLPGLRRVARRLCGA